MIGRRMSALPVAEFCGQSDTLDNSSGRAAVISTAFHAWAAGQPRVQAFAGLTQDEQTEVMAMKRPADVSPGSEVVLTYANAEKETEFALTAALAACSPDDPLCLTVGHEDMGWTVDWGGRKVSFTGDIKRTEWTTLDGPESLQLVAYGFARAIRDGADMFCCGIWDATGGQWHWGEMVDLESDLAVDLWARIVHAATNRGEFRRGAHCSSCYSRKRCPAYLLPKEHFEGTQLDALTKEDPSQEQVKAVLLWAQSSRDAAEVALKWCKEQADNLGGVRDEETGKVFRGVNTKGRESIDQNKLLAEVPNAERFFRRGPDFKTYRWVKA